MTLIDLFVTIGLSWWSEQCSNDCQCGPYSCLLFWYSQYFKFRPQVSQHYQQTHRPFCRNWYVFDSFCISLIINWSIVTLPPPIPVTADIPATHAAEARKLQLEAWKKDKASKPQSNKENQENFSAQIERIKQEMKKEVKQEMWMDVSNTVEKIVKQFLR